MLAKGRQALGAVRNSATARRARPRCWAILAEQLTAIYLRHYRARLFRAAALLTLIEPAQRRGPSALADDCTPNG